MANYIDEIFEEKDIVVTTGLVYSETPHYECDMYMPPSDSTEDKKPVVIFLHGGGGDKADGKGWSMTWAQRGYIGVSANFRDKVGNYNGEEQMLATSNIFALIRWLRKNAEEYGIVKSKIFVMGVSEGAVTAVQSGICANEAQADMEGFFAGIDYNKSQPNHRIRIAATATISGAATNKFLAFLDEKDPENHAYNGTEDQMIDYNQAVKTVESMNALGIPSTLMTFEGADHSIGHGDEIHADLIPKFAKLATNN